MSSTHLSSGRLNIGLLQEQTRKQLVNLIERCDGPKAIVWDRSLDGPVGLIARYSLLEEYGVVKMYQLVGGQLPPTNVSNIIFIVRPHLDMIDLIAENVHGEQNRSPKEFHIFFVPRKSLLCQKKLQNRGVFGSFTLIEEFPCDLFPFDSDLMSMELSQTYKEFFLENDPTCLYQVAQAIRRLQRLYGKIPRVTGRGPAANKVWELLKRLDREEEDVKLERGPLSTPPIEHLLLVDRSIDLLSPLVTQLTYEGLIDEIFGIQNTTVQLPAGKFKDNDDSPTVMSVDKKEKIVLNSGEELFAEIRDKNFNGVGPVLSQKAKIISSQFDERHGDKSVQEIKQFVARLPHMLATKQSLARHTTIAEMVKEVTDSNDFLECLQVEQELLNCIDTDKPNAFIEDCIAQQKPLLKVLRLLCIQSLTNSGLKQKLLDYYKREIVQTYGYQHLPTLLNLEKAGLLRAQQSNRQYAVLRKALRLTVEDESEIAPKDISYVHSVYAPLSVRLAEQLVQPGGWQGLNDVLGLLPGPAVSTDSRGTISGMRRGSFTSEDSTAEPPRLVLVFFIGGCTYAEVSALRFLSQQEDLNVEFVVGTTKLINGNTFLTSLMDDLETSRK
ncbi:vacuolar protein sorting-associated protein 33A [Fopius arisanus]|uniref:Vacuolar protein sorting-associated protein 33A n=1 Tax=Fopius arisanus TaxID=64838 RepID=A0A0C9PWJ5_9HYME|nr:PREDICTED: vacuolar protein sorting-associated protein 33A [Fopius arisanus]